MTQVANSNGSNLLVQGRIVWVLGDLFQGKNKTNYDNNQPVYGEDGQPVKEYGFGLAIPKLDPRTGQNAEQFVKVWQTLHQEAFTLFPSGQLPPDFAMKFKDGDGIDHQGQSFAQREGYSGHIILSCTTQIPLKFFIWQGGNNVVVNTGIKCGDYVNVQLNVKAHPAKGRGKAGLYLNPSAVQLIQPGKEIINTPSGDQLFGNSAPAYAGQVVAPTAAPMPQANAPQQPQMAPMPGMGQPAMAPATHQYSQQPMQAAPQQPVAPHYGVLPNQFQPQQPQMAPMPGMGQPAMAPATPAMPQMPGMPR